jgi:hypothetical protein
VRKIALLGLLGALFFTPLTYSQRQLPNDNELRSAYCVPVLQAAITEYRSTAEMFGEGVWSDGFRASAAAAEDGLKRLQSYLIPKLRQLDTPSLQAAHDRGQADAQRAPSEQVACFRQCEPVKPATGFDDRYGRCLSSCRAARPVIARTKACEAVDWLPF